MSKGQNLTIWLIIITVFLLALHAPAQEQSPAFGIDDLKRMLADRDIALEQQSRVIATLQKENTELKKAAEKCKDAAAEKK